MDLWNLSTKSVISRQDIFEFVVNNSHSDYTENVLNFILKIMKVNERYFFNNNHLQQLQYHNSYLCNYFLHLDEDATYNFDSYNLLIISFLRTTEENNIDLLPNALEDYSNFFVTILKFIEILINNYNENLTNVQKLCLKFIGARLSLPFINYLGTNKLLFQTNETQVLLKYLFDKFLKYAMFGVRSCDFGMEIASEICKTFKINYKLLTEDRFYVLLNILEIHNKRIQSKMSEFLNYIITKYPNEIEIINLMKYLKSEKKILQLFLINKALLAESFVKILIAIDPICTTDQLFKIFLKIFHYNNDINLRSLVGQLYIKLLKSSSANLNNNDILANSLKYLSQASCPNDISIFFNTFWDFEFMKDNSNIITNIINIITHENNLYMFILNFCVEYARKLCEEKNNNSNNIIDLITKIPLLLDKLKNPQDITIFLEIFKVIDLSIYKQMDQKHLERILNKINRIQQSCTEFKNSLTINVNLLTQIFIVLDLFSSADLDQSKKLILGIKHDNLVLFYGCFQRLTANETNNNKLKLYKVLNISLIKLTYLIVNVKFNDEEEYTELYKSLIEFFEKNLLKDKVFKKFTDDFNDIAAESYAIKCFNILLQRYYSNHSLLIRTFLKDEYNKFQELCYYFAKYLLQPNIYERNEIDYVSNRITALMSCIQFICNPKAEKFYMANIRNVLYNQTLNQLVLILNISYKNWDQPESVVDKYLEIIYKNLIQLHCVEIDSDIVFKILLNTNTLKWNVEIKELLNVIVANQSAERTASLLAALIFEIAAKRILSSRQIVVDQLQKIITEKLPIKSKTSELHFNFLIIESATVMKVLEKLTEAVSKRNQIPDDGNIMIALKFLENFLQYFRVYPDKIEILKTEVHQFKSKIWVKLNSQELEHLLLFQKVLQRL